MKFRDYYEVLGIHRTATQEEIQKAFRKLAREYHPDINKTKGAEDRFKEINEANEVLSDPEKRKRYDALGANWRAGQDFQPPPDWEAGGGSFRFNFGDEGGNFGGFSDFFEAMFGGSGFTGSGFSGGAAFGGGHRTTSGRVQPSAEAQLDISIEDSIRGVTKSIQVRDAHGSQRALQVKIPQGIRDGGTIRLAGKQGEPDLYLKVRLAKHPRYACAGNDLLVTLPISPWEAALGAKIDLELPDGAIKVTLPAGSQSGSKLRIRGRGFSVSRGERGDALAEVKIVIPTTLSSVEKEGFEKLAQSSRFNPRG